MFSRAERTRRIEKFEKSFKEAKGIYLTDFTGIDVEKIDRFRADLRKENASYIVVKNTLARIAMERAGLEDLIPYLKGPVGIVVANEDAVAPAKVLKKFKSDNKELLGLKAAFLDGSLFGVDDILKLADIPSREVLLAQLLSVLKAPVTNFAGSLNAILVKLVGTLNALKDKKENEGN